MSGARTVSRSAGRARRAVLLAPLVLLGACALGRDAAPDWAQRVAAGQGLETLQGTRWQWIAGGLASRPVIVARPERYLVEFLQGNRIEVRADCNRGLGAWSTHGPAFTVGPVVYSDNRCGADSRGSEFAAALLEAKAWHVRDGSLFLELPYDHGWLRLAPWAPAARP